MRFRCLLVLVSLFSCHINEILLLLLQLREDVVDDSNSRLHHHHHLLKTWTDTCCSPHFESFAWPTTCLPSVDYPGQNRSLRGACREWHGLMAGGRRLQIPAAPEWPLPRHHCTPAQWAQPQLRSSRELPLFPGGCLHVPKTFQHV